MRARRFTPHSSSHRQSRGFTRRSIPDQLILPAYRLPSTYDRPPLRRRASGLALALGINLLLLLALLGIGKFAPMAQKASETLTIDLLPPSQDAAKQDDQQSKPLERQRPKAAAAAEAAADRASGAADDHSPARLPSRGSK